MERSWEGGLNRRELYVTFPLCGRLGRPWRLSREDLDEEDEAAMMNEVLELT